MTSPYVLKSWGSRERPTWLLHKAQLFLLLLPEDASYSRWNCFSGSPGSKGCELVSRAPFGGPFSYLVLSSASVCLSC